MKTFYFILGHSGMTVIEGPLVPQITMPRSKTKSKATPHSNLTNSNNRAPPHKAPPSSTIPLMIPPIVTLTTEPDRGDTSELLNHTFPLSSARDEPGTSEPLLEHSVFVSIPSPPPSPPKGSKKSRPRRSDKLAAINTQESARPLRDLENIPHDSPLTSQVVAENVKTKRGKIQVQKSFRVLRPRACQLSVGPREEPLGARTCPSAQRLTQDTKENEKPYWEVSWDRWTHARGTIRRTK